MGIIWLTLASASILICLFACKDEGDSGEKSDANPSFEMGLEAGTSSAGEKQEKLEAIEVLVKEKLTSRHNFFYERLKGIEEVATKGGIKMLGGADHHLLVMAGSHRLLEQAIRLQKALSTFVDYFSRENLTTKKVAEELRAFWETTDAIKELCSQTEVKLMTTLHTLMMAEEVKKNAQEMVRIMEVIRKLNVKMAELADHTLTAFDRSIGSLALVTKSNTFLQLQRAKQLLERASSLRKAINKIWAKKLGENNGTKTELDPSTQHVVREYNDFARKLEHFGDGVHRNLYGKFHLADIDRKIEELTNNKVEKYLPVLDADFWMLIRQLLHDYCQLDLPPMNEIKIRGNGHTVLCIGQIEYDYVEQSDGGTRRRKFREDLDEYTSESIGKATPLANAGLIKMEDADRIFYKMVQHGWDGKSYSMEQNRYCGTFVWNFLCQLLGECPSEENMPLNFMALDNAVPSIGSVFRHPEFVIPNKRKYGSENCSLKQHEVKLRFSGNDSKDDTELPPIIEYTTGVYYGRFPLTKPFSVQEQTAEVADEKGNKSASATDLPKQRHFSAKLMAYACKGKDAGKEFSYVENLRVFDQKYENFQIQLKAKSGRGSGYKDKFEVVDLVTIKNKGQVIEVSAAVSAAVGSHSSSKGPAV